MSDLVAFTGYILLAYFVGAIPTGYLVVKKMMGIDIREHGSGNVGATNVKRVAGGKAALFVLFFDFLKGMGPVLLAKYLFPGHEWIHVFTALSAILGHSKSIFLGFTGGKSAATGLGSMLGMTLIPGLILGLIAFTTIKITKTVSVGSILASILAPVIIFAFDEPLPYIIYGLVSGLYVIILHRANIIRLFKGTENRLQ